MMGLSISVISKKPRKEWGVLSVKGRIQINDYTESLYVPLDWWTLDDYKRQWQEGLERIKTHNESCLVVTIYDPRIQLWVEWWTLYRDGNKIFIHNCIIPPDIYMQKIGIKPFTLETCYNFIPPRRRYPKSKVSEWLVFLD